MTIQPGAPLRTRRVPSVSAEAMKTMAVVLADPNPIHLDPAAAKASGLGDRVVNQGPTNLGYVLDMLRENFPSGEIATVSVRFLANVFAGDDVTAGGTVQSVTPIDGGGHRIECDVWLDVAGRGHALAGRATVVTR
jgi:acyl dehydratase